ncbi:5,10-methylenetetrahydrofolate reductase [Planctomycetales bacterium]|nr:5,10-methylenetetrahydrofolate reductase [Planctomycetales bacterium]GHT09246.1 5,10-methylenetetrahydrofolate reductase [Planctomycetales bacterium]
MINHLIKERLYHRRAVFSFEFFPPKTPAGETALYQTVEKLLPMRPDFVSVTYGAGGSTRETTRRLVLNIKERYDLEVMPHLTCVGNSAAEITQILAAYADAGITNVLALRGDPPKNQPAWQPAAEPLQHAVELVRLMRAAPFSVGVAGFPEKHPQAATLADDLARLKEKIDAGADFVITQLFFDNNLYFNYVAAARQLGITVPIIAGVMPVTKRGQLEKFREISNCYLPAALEDAINGCANDAEAQEVGLAYGAAQCADLLRGGAPGIHFYTLNQSTACVRIHAALQALGHWR